MKKFYIVFLTITLSFYGIAWGQPTSYGFNAGNGGNNTNSYFGYEAGSNNTANNNTFIGHRSGLNHSIGSYNAFIGDNTGANSQSGGFNTFVGSGAGFSTGGSDNTFLGAITGQSVNGNNNTILGSFSVVNGNTGNANTIIGAWAALNKSSGDGNVFLGERSGYNNSTGSHNVFLGYRAGYSEAGSNLLYIANSDTASPLIWGDFANDSLRINGTLRITNIPQDAALSRILVSDDDGTVHWRDSASLGGGTFPSYPDSAGDGGDNTNTYFGHEAGLNNTQSFNTFIGHQSGFNNDLGDGNTFVGHTSGYSNLGGYSNTFLGINSGYNNTGGNENTFVGRGSGYNNQTGSGNVFLGRQAGYNETGSNLLYIANSDTASPLIWGDFANDSLQINGTLRITNIPQDATLSRILVSDDDGAVHWRDAGTIGNDNLGNHQVIQDLVPDSDNTYNLGGNGNAYNSIYFDGALFINDTEFLHSRNGNIALGTNAAPVASGTQNVAIGEEALLENSSGSSNVGVGTGALRFNSTGVENTAIGNDAGVSQFGIGSRNNTTTIGNGARATFSNQVRIGNAAVTSIGGVVDWSVVSDGRFKNAIQEDVPGLAFIEKLRPVSYELDRQKLHTFLRGGNSENAPEEPSGRTTGFVAQEVAQLLDEQGYVFSGIERPKHEQDHYSISYAQFVVPLVKGMQEQQQIIRELREELEALKSVIYGTESAQPVKSTGGLKTSLPEGFLLSQNIPNPFDQTTTITAALPVHVNEARIVIYDMQGVELQRYPLYQRGKTSVEIKGGSLPSGMYLYALLADGKLIDTKKMILTR